jgi:hypothetical protein
MPPEENTESLALSGSKIEHYISEMKADIKFCSNSLSVFSAKSRSFSGPMDASFDIHRSPEG